MDFEEALRAHKDSFEDWRALVVLDDKALRRYVMCWTPHLVRRLHDWPAGETLPDLWDCVRVDLKALGDLTGDSPPDVMARLRQAQGLKVIYPDGTVADTVARVLRKKLQEIFDL